MPLAPPPEPPRRPDIMPPIRYPSNPSLLARLGRWLSDRITRR